MSRERRGAEAEEREMEVEGAKEGEEEFEETGQGRKTKTGRNVCFSHDENCVLVYHIVPCYEVILGNLAARTPLRRHHQLWARVCDAVNAVRPLKRSVAHCRKRSSDIKRRLKEKMAAERRSTRRTGGGPPLRMEYTSYEEELRQIMPAEIVEGINVQDTDSPSFGQVVDSPGPQLSPSPRPTPSTFSERFVPRRASRAVFISGTSAGVPANVP
ncbi:myb-related transcription factor, partner of profilin-like [Mixophyes fleayi]|uniref:myb-related transcription factor, partner of profilin-like n=1 Tax=Mixophyes fleayi TaxID=3061075 RepID=UPI003F4DC243